VGARDMERGHDRVCVCVMGVHVCDKSVWVVWGEGVGGSEECACVILCVSCVSCAFVRVRMQT